VIKILNNYLSHHLALGAVFLALVSTGLVVVVATAGFVVAAGLVVFPVGLITTGACLVVSTTLVAASFFSAFCLSCYFFCFLLFSKY
jgi:hypothetical protein